jgi:hypothetical protein
MAVARTARVFVCVVLLSLGVAAPAEAFIYWTDSSDYSIGRASIDGSGANDSFIADLPGVCGLAADGGFVYWGNSRLGAIGRATLDGADVDQSLIGGGLGTCGVSATGGSLAWANFGNGQSFDTSSIGIGSKNGATVRQTWVVGPADVNGPLGTASYDDGGGDAVYWVNEDGSIWRTPFEAQTPDQILPPLTVPGQAGIAVSAAGIFWEDAAHGRIGHSNLDGSDPEIIVTGLEGSPCGIAVDDSFLYWASQSAGAIGRSLLDGSSPDPDFIELGEQVSPCWLAVDADTASASVAPSQLAFGGVLVDGGPTPALDVTLSNSSDTSVDLVPAAPGIVGPNADQFTVSGDTCGATVPPGDSCSISVQFSPTSLGGKFATLTISTNDPSDNPVKVSVFGTGTDPEQSVAPSSISFGDQLVETTGADHTVTLTNGAGASSPDEIGQATLAGPDSSEFEVVSDDCSNTTVAIGDSCQLSLRFAPAVTGDAQASLSIPSDDPTSPATVAVSGTGTTPDLQVSPSSLQFGTQFTGEGGPTQTIDVDNSADGSGPLLTGAVSLGGADAGDFDLVFDNCSGASISPGDDCQIGVRYAPAASGPSQASVQIPSNGSTSPVVVALSGSGQATPVPPENPACTKLRAKLKKAKKRTTRRKLRKRLKRLGC